MVIVVDSDTLVQNLNKAIYILHWADSLGEGMNPTILPAMGKNLSWLDSLTLE